MTLTDRQSLLYIFIYVKVDMYSNGSHKYIFAYGQVSWHDTDLVVQEPRGSTLPPPGTFQSKDF